MFRFFTTVFCKQTMSSIMKEVDDFVEVPRGNIAKCNEEIEGEEVKMTFLYVRQGQLELELSETRTKTNVVEDLRRVVKEKEAFWKSSSYSKLLNLSLNSASSGIFNVCLVPCQNSLYTLCQVFMPRSRPKPSRWSGKENLVTKVLLRKKR